MIFAKEDFKKNIKGKCSSCGAKIPQTWDHYQRCGNTCEECSVRAAHKTLYNK